MRFTGCGPTAVAILALFQASATAFPGFLQKARHETRAANVADEYDYIIVGGGTSGLTVADRLTEAGNSTVLVVEYGYFDDDEAILTVRGGIGGVKSSRMFNITSVAQPKINNRTVDVWIGCVVGGSSAVNGMVFARGAAEDYDRFAELGAEGSDWNWKGLLPYFKKSVTFMPPVDYVAEEFDITWDTDAAYGGHTPIFASYPTFQYPGTKIMFDAWSDFDGVEYPIEGAAGKTGVLWFPNSVDGRSVTRSYARTGHYDGLDRENYVLLTGHRGNRIVLSKDSSTAEGILITPREGSAGRTIRAKREVILAAGALHTPQILQRSGIGPRKLLEAAGIKVKVDLPGVGQNFQDQSFVQVSFPFGTDVQPNPSSLQDNDTFIDWADHLWEKNRTGPYSMSAGNAAAFLGLPVIAPTAYRKLAKRYENQDPAAFLPPDSDETVVAGYAAQQAAMAKGMRSRDTAFIEFMMTGQGGGLVMSMHPASRGTVNIDPENPNALDPLIDYRALTNPMDMKVMIELIRGVRRYFASPGLKELSPEEELPGADVQTDEELTQYIREGLSPTIYHPVGTAAKMPRELGGVVGEDLLVHGVQGLSIIDASVIPLIPGSVTSSTVYAIAEKAADLIKARA